MQEADKWLVIGPLGDTHWEASLDDALDAAAFLKSALNPDYRSSVKVYAMIEEHINFMQ